MLLREVSDLHLEFGDFDLPELPTDRETVLILAGDIGLADKGYTYQLFVEEMAARFREVIYILGNHEFYKTSFVTAFGKIDKAFSGYDNVNIVDNQTITIDDVAFVCSTLWTNFNNGDPNAMNQARYEMNDYRQIRTGTPETPYHRKLRPEDTFIAHEKAVNFIFNAIPEQKQLGKKVVVITHHLPSYLSVLEQFKGDPLNSAYATELFDKIAEAQPDLWFHGHTHASFDYMIEQTRVVCNPRGYYGVETNPAFDPKMLINI